MRPGAKDKNLHPLWRQGAYFHGRTDEGKETFTEKMKRKIDSTAGRALYSLRVAIAEPPCGHICRIMGLHRFTLRGKGKVNIQWNLFCIVHNLQKVARYGLGMRGELARAKLFDNEAVYGGILIKAGATWQNK